MEKGSFRNRVISVFLSLFMALTMVPGGSFAAGSTEPATTEGTRDERGRLVINAHQVINDADDTAAVRFRGVHGRAYEMFGGSFGTVGNEKPLKDGMKIRFQWMDSDGAVSPVYEAFTQTPKNGKGGTGWYSFDDKKLSFKDGNGKLHKLAYQTTRQRYRLWLAPGQTSESGNEYVTARQAHGGQVGFYKADQNSAGTFMVADAHFTKTGVFVYEKPGDDYTKLIKNAPYQDNFDKGLFGRPEKLLSGRVWWETKSTDMAFPVDIGEENVKQEKADYKTGIRVVNMMLKPEGIKVAQAWEKANKKATVRERINYFGTLVKDHPEYVETVVTPVKMMKDNDSGYAAQFSTRIDQNYLYQFVVRGEDNEVLPSINGFPAPLFHNPDEFIHGGSITTANGGLYMVKNALVNSPFESTIDITNYNVSDLVASPGDTATIKVNSNFLKGNNTEIKWIDQEGNEIKGQTKVVTNKKDADAITFKVPENLDARVTYSVQLVINGVIVDADSFVANPLPKLNLHRNGPDDLDKDGKEKAEAVERVNLDKDTEGKVTLPVMRDREDYQNISKTGKSFVGWSTNKDATAPDKEAEKYITDGSKFTVGETKDLYAVWKDPFTVTVKKKWSGANGDDYKDVKFGLMYRVALTKANGPTINRNATFTPVPENIAPIKTYDGSDMVWKNLP